ITKNGEMMQIIRITAGATGVDYESPEPDVLTLRDAVRRAINESVKSERYAYWFHTIRRRIPIHHHPEFKEPFATQLNQAWQEARRWQHSYTNEVYISVLREGQSAEMFDFKEIAKGLLPGTNRKYREAHADQMNQELNDTVKRILENVSAHSNARRL